MKMDILVSINCMAYNHEKYMAKAMDGFLMQKTDFAYEIIIGEDCSTDGTRKIVKEYAERFPEKIIVITSEKNVGWLENSLRIHKKSRGKYIALCEGDDYWIDPYKLQKQADYMKAHPLCTLCYHNAFILNMKTGEKTLFFNERMKSRLFHAGDMAEQFIPTASRMYVKESFDVIPAWYFACVVEDLPSQLIQTYRGCACYMSDIMSVYRWGVANSATQTLFESRTAREKIIANDNNMLAMLDHFNEFSKYQYNAQVNKRKKEFQIRNALLLKDKLSLRTILKAEPMVIKIKFYAQFYLPRFYRKLRKERLGVKFMMDNNVKLSEYVE